MSSTTKPHAPAHPKAEQPTRHFSDPTDVVADPTLSAADKRHALKTLEQDARQLAIASAEGMSGGEETNLAKILQVERELEESHLAAAERK